MKYAFALIAVMIVLSFFAGCQSVPRIYTEADKTCTWDNVEELIICKGDSPK
jgi:hypothetical protein